MKKRFGDLHFNDETSKTTWVRLATKFTLVKPCSSDPVYGGPKLSFPSSHLPVHSGKQPNAWANFRLPPGSYPSLLFSFMLQLSYFIGQWLGEEVSYLPQKELRFTARREARNREKKQRYEPMGYLCGSWWRTGR